MGREADARPEHGDRRFSQRLDEEARPNRKQGSAPSSDDARDQSPESPTADEALADVHVPHEGDQR